MSAKKSRREEEQEPTFEEAMSRLEAIVKELEGSELPLEKTLEMFEEGVKLSKVCHRKLTEAEKKVQVLMKNREGEMETRPFEGEAAEDEDETGDGEEHEEEDNEEGSGSLF